MKKTHLIIAIFAAITIMGTIPIQAESPIKSAQRQFNDNIERFKKCVFKLDCTKWEALKLVRDITIAAGLVITTMYAAGTVLRKEAHKTPFRRQVWKTGRMLQRPGKPFVEAGTRAVKAGQRGVEAAEQWAEERLDAAAERFSPSPFIETERGSTLSPEFIMQQQRQRRSK